MSQTKRAGSRNMPVVGIYRPPAARSPPGDTIKLEDQANAKSLSRQRRPDMQVYVPRARRLAPDLEQASPTSEVTPSPPKSSRHRNCSPSIVTPRKKSHKTCELVNRTPSCESDISNYDINDHKESIIHLSANKLTDGNNKVNTSQLSNLDINKSVQNSIISSPQLESRECAIKLSTNHEKLPNCLETIISNDLGNQILKHKSKENEDTLNDLVSNTSVYDVDFCDKSVNCTSKLNANHSTLVVNTSQNDKKKCNDLPTPVSSLKEKKSLQKTLSSPPVLKISETKQIAQRSPKATDNVPHISSIKCSETSKEERKETKLIKQFSTSMQRTEGSNLKIEECSWDVLFDENGDCVDPTLMEELTQAVGRVQVTRPSLDYSAYETAREAVLAERDYPHVLEVYGFSAEFKTQDLMAVLSPVAGPAGCDLKWVDDTHALVVFSNSRIAAEVLSLRHPLVQTRPLSQASAESRQKARRSSQFLLPYRPRPETCTAMAKRMVSSALGVRLQTSREEREKEKNQLREARERKRLAAKQSEEAWEGITESKQ